MKVTVKKISIIAFITMIYGMSFLSFAQTKESDEKSLQGKWTLENVSAFEDNVQKLPFSVDNIDSEIPKEIDIQQDNITFGWKESKQKVKREVVVNGNSLCFPICAEWKIVDNKLQLQWMQDIDSPTDDLKMRTIVLTYSRK